MRKPIEQSNITLTLRDVYALRDSFYYNLPTQRNYIWKQDKKDKLIDSVINRFFIGIVCVHRNNNKKEVLDAQQRLRTLIGFINNDWKLSDDFILSYANDENEQQGLAGRYFRELPSDIQTDILSYPLLIAEFYGMDEAQTNELMARLNNGMPLTTIEKTRMLTHGNLQEFVSKLSSSELFSRKMNIVETDKKTFLNDKIAYHIIFLETGLYEVLNTANFEELALRVKDENLLTDDIENTIINTTTYINDCIPMRHYKNLNALNSLPIYLVAKKAIEDGMNELNFFKLLEEFFAKGLDKVKLNGSKLNRWTDKNIMSSRIEALNKFYDENKNNYI